jgi:hypothetical protein
MRLRCEILIGFVLTSAGLIGCGSGSGTSGDGKAPQEQKKGTTSSAGKKPDKDKKTDSGDSEVRNSPQDQKKKISPENRKAFIDQKKEIGPRLEWNREVNSKSGGTFSFRVTSDGPFAVTLITDKGYKAIKMGKTLTKQDLLLTVDSKDPSFEGKATVAAGSSWFIIENQTDKNVTIHLQCFAP